MSTLTSSHHSPKIGDIVKVVGFSRTARIIELRGRLGLKGMRVYRVIWTDSQDGTEAFEVPETLIAAIKVGTRFTATLTTSEKVSALE